VIASGHSFQPSLIFVAKAGSRHIEPSAKRWLTLKAIVLTSCVRLTLTVSLTETLDPRHVHITKMRMFNSKGSRS
jgi:hypothetical protein